MSVSVLISYIDDDGSNNRLSRLYILGNQHFRYRYRFKSDISIRAGPTIGYIDYAFGINDNIGIGIGCNRYNRLGSGQQSVISIILLVETIISISISVVIGIID